MLKGVKNCASASPISHLLYVDDSLFFFEVDHFLGPKDALDTCCKRSGQLINASKSSLICGPNVAHDYKKGIADTLGVKLSSNLGNILVLG